MSSIIMPILSDDVDSDDIIIERNEIRVKIHRRVVIHKAGNKRELKYKAKTVLLNRTSKGRCSYGRQHYIQQ